MLEAVFFYLFAGGAIAAALGVAFARVPLYAVLSLVLAMGFIAGLFALLQATLVAWILLLVYAGAVLVLFVFVVMLLQLDKAEPGAHPASKAMAALVAGGVFAVLMTLGRPVTGIPAMNADPQISGGTEAIARLLFNRYLVPFELTSVLLLAAVLSIVVLAKKAKA